MKVALKEKISNKKKLKYSLSLQNKILLPFLTLIIFATGIISYVSYHFNVTNTTEELSKNVENEMFVVNESFELFFSNIDSILERFSSNSVVLNSSDKIKQDVLQ